MHRKRAKDCPLGEATRTIPVYLQREGGVMSSPDSGTGGSLGEFCTEIVGVQHHDGEARQGEAVVLQREPGNPHDKNAVRVDNSKGEHVGYLPREVADWLAPLLDAGKVRLEGTAQAATNDEDDRSSSFRVPLELKVSLLEAGSSILERSASPQSPVEEAHEKVRAAWMEAENCTDPSVAAGLEPELGPDERRSASPGTELLLHLFPRHVGKAQQTARNRLVEAVGSHLERIKVGQPLHYRNLTIFPLIGPNGHEPPYSLLGPAIGSGEAEVREVDEDGNVPELLLRNRGKRPLLITEGEILIGAKQNRVVNLTVLVAAESESNLSVSCVEEGRWDYTSDSFETVYAAPPALRSKKITSVQEQRQETGLVESDQSEVWGEVAACLDMTGSASETQSISDAFIGAEDRLAEYREHFQLPEETTGFLVARGERVVGMDLFDCPQTLSELWGQLSDAHFMEASSYPDEEAPTGEEAAKQFLDRVRQAIRPCEEPVGLGTELELSDPELAGTGVYYRDTLCHLSALAHSV